MSTSAWRLKPDRDGRLCSTVARPARSGGGAALVLALLLAGCGTVARPAGNDPLSGREVFERVCAACHGIHGEGRANSLRAPPLNGEGYAWRHADERIRRLIERGGRVMPALGDQLSPAEIQAVIAYLRTLWTPEQQATHAATQG